MKKDTRELLESLIQNRLEIALEENDENSKAFKEAMEAIDRQLELEKRELELQKEEFKMKHETNQAKLNTAVKVAEITAAVILAPMIDFRCKEAFAHMLCEFEKDYNFTTMAGKSLSALFKFKK